MRILEGRIVEAAGPTRAKCLQVIIRSLFCLSTSYLGLMISQYELLLARKSGAKSILSSRRGGVCQSARLVKGLSKYSELLDEEFGGAGQAEMNIWAAVTVTVS